MPCREAVGLEPLIATVLLVSGSFQPSSGRAADPQQTFGVSKSGPLTFVFTGCQKAVRWNEWLGVAAALSASWVIERLQATIDNAVADVLGRWLSNVFHYKLRRDGLPRKHEAPRRT